MKARSLIYCIILSIVVILSLSTAVQATEYREVKAEDILKQIENGEGVNYTGYRIIGELNTSKVKLEPVPNSYYYKLLNEGYDKEYLIYSGFSENLHVIKSNITFKNSIFENDFNFSNMLFNSGADFSGANFNSDADFSGANFNSGADFDKVNFNNTADFENVNFNNTADFENVNFNNTADFENVNFNGDALFIHSTWSAISGDVIGPVAGFSGTKFNGNANFYWATFNGFADFWGADFSSDVYFSSAKFKSIARFSKANFNSNADFSSSTWSEIRSDIASAEADFSGANFNSGADFCVANFSSGADFTGASFSSGADFLDASFNRIADFDKVNFNRTADFSGAKFNCNIYLSEADASKKILTDGKTYEILRKYYNDEARYTDADNIYFNFRKKAMEDKSFTSFSKWIDILSLVTCGYGTSLYPTTFCILFSMVFFAIVYKNPRVSVVKIKYDIMFPKFYFGKPGIYKSSEENNENKSNVSFLECLCFSINAFTRLGSENWRQRDKFWNVVTIEGLLGWVMLGIFTSTLMRLLIRS